MGILPLAVTATPAGAVGDFPEMTEILDAFEAYATDYGTFRTPAGYNNNGNGWFALDGTAQYSATISSVLVNLGYLADNNYENDPTQYFIRTCSNGRIAVMTASTAEVSAEHEANWVGCPTLSSRPYYQTSATLTEVASAARAARVAPIIAALEAYGADNGSFRVPGGYKGNGAGWFAFDGTTNYTTSIASVLISEGYLVDDNYSAIPREFAIYPCSNARVAVFARSDVPVDAVDAANWVGCNTNPITLWNREYYEVSKTLQQLKAPPDADEFIVDSLGVISTNLSDTSGTAITGDGDVYVVNNGNGQILELTTSASGWAPSAVSDPGNVLTGRDVEGLTWITGDYFAAVAERRSGTQLWSTMHVFEIVNGVLTDVSGIMNLTSISSGAGGNKGLEGVAHAPLESDADTWVFYTVKEVPATLHRIEYDVSGQFASVTNTVALTGLSDANGIAVADSWPTNLYVVSEDAESVTRFVVDSDDPNVITETGPALDVSGMQQPEGISMIRDGAFHVMHVVGEPNQVWTLRSPVGTAFDADSFTLNTAGTAATGLGDLSGVTVTKSGDVYAVDNGNGQILELVQSGANWTSTVVSDPNNVLAGRDTEGISWIRDDYFVVVSERRSSSQQWSTMHIVEIVNGVISDVSGVLDLTSISSGAGGNKGLEGVVWAQFESRADTWVFYAVKEIPSRLYRIEYDLVNQTVSVTDSAPLGMTDAAGVAIAVAWPTNVYVLSEDDKNVRRFSVDPMDQSSISEVGSPLDLSAMNQPEGIFLTRVGPARTMWVVGEPNQFSTFESGVPD